MARPPGARPAFRDGTPAPSGVRKSPLMITLDFKLSAEWHPYDIDLRTTDALELRYDAFLGDVVFRIDEHDFSAQWGWVPVLDFALALRTIAERIATSEHELFEFTESGATIDFRRQGALITVSSSYSQAIATVALAEMTEATADHLQEVVARLVKSYPAVAENEFFAELRQR
ncbi:MAG TPA: hypothetical protein VNT22_00550 [Baekduia sp.]|nr:hypothetical protein [Baekduia sp.]